MTSLPIFEGLSDRKMNYLESRLNPSVKSPVEKSQVKAIGEDSTSREELFFPVGEVKEEVRLLGGDLGQLNDSSDSRPSDGEERYKRGSFGAASDEGRGSVKRSTESLSTDPGQIKSPKQQKIEESDQMVVSSGRFSMAQFIIFPH